MRYRTARDCRVKERKLEERKAIGRKKVDEDVVGDARD